VFGLYVSIATTGALACAVMAPIAIQLIATHDYLAAARPALWLAFAAVAQGAYYVAGIGINLSLRNELVMVAAGGAALVAAAANFLLVPRFGAEGAAVATFLGYCTSAVLIYVIAQRVHPLPYRGARLAALFGAGVLLGAVVVHVPAPGATGWAWRGGAVIAYVLLAWKSDVWKDRGALRHRPATP